ncbi:glycosyltransferase family 4 protein [Cryomorphaceae bacterium 1068]|nr:glycosyltransferase family 4 protein [Cryomorphaceae bacterium 1068]
MLEGSRILMLLDAPYPKDIRLEKEISALIDAGANVTLVCYRKEGEPRREKVDGCNVVRTAEVITNSKKGWVDIWNSISFINRPIKKVLDSLEVEFDVVHGHDLPIVNTALQFARERGIKCVFDVHENYPEALKVWFGWRRNHLIRLKNQMFFNYSRWIEREREMVQACDAVIAVVDEMKTRLCEIHDISTDKVTVVSNTEPKDRFDTIGKTDNSDLNRVVYVGGIGPHRGLDTAIKAMPEMLKYSDDFRLQIVGAGNSDTIGFLKQLVAERKLENYVEFTGHVPLEKALGYMRGAYLNIIPHHANEHTNNTIPHKLFQIMNSGFPLMVSSCLPLKRIVEDHKAGLVFEAGDSTSFAEQMAWSLKNQEQIARFTINARDAVQNKGLNWENDAGRLVALYSRLIGRSS